MTRGEAALLLHEGHKHSYVILNYWRKTSFYGIQEDTLLQRSSAQSPTGLIMLSFRHQGMHGKTFVINLLNL